MNQIDQTVNTLFNIKRDVEEKTVFHVAGHAASIYLVNKRKQLPAVQFHIHFKQRNNGASQSCFEDGTFEYSAIIEGGRLIQSLPSAFEMATRYFSQAQREQYRFTLETDVVNLLAGAIAEAKYVALCDDELFTPNLVNLDALQYYGGDSDLALINEYMACYIPVLSERERKLKELFLEAFHFVDKRSNWRAITKLAGTIRHENKSTLSYEEIASLLRPYSNQLTTLETPSYPMPLSGRALSAVCKSA